MQIPPKWNAKFSRTYSQQHLIGYVFQASALTGTVAVQPKMILPMKMVAKPIHNFVIIISKCCPAVTAAIYIQLLPMAYSASSDGIFSFSQSVMNWNIPPFFFFFFYYHHTECFIINTTQTSNIYSKKTFISPHLATLDVLPNKIAEHDSNISWPINVWREGMVGCLWFKVKLTFSIKLARLFITKVYYATKSYIKVKVR